MITQNCITMNVYNNKLDQATLRCNALLPLTNSRTLLFEQGQSTPGTNSLMLQGI